MATLKEAQDKVRELSLKALAVAESPTMTFAEMKTALNGEDGKSGIEADIKKWEDEVAALSFVEEKRAQYAAATGSHVEDGADDKDTKSLGSIGSQFVQSDGYKSLMDRGLKGGSWSSGDVEVKTTFTEGNAGAPGPGFAPVGQPTVLPGIVDIRFKPLTIADLFPAGTTTTPLIRYLVETAVTNAAATVAEGNLKPESALSFGKVDEVLHKIATFLPISDEMLEDWAQARSYIDARLLLFVKLAEEAQLLNGDGTGSNLVGLLNRGGLATTVVKGSAPSTGSDNSMDAIYRQITAIRVTQFLEPDALAIDPLGWGEIMLAKNSQGQYYANGPFADMVGQALWGKRVAVSPAMADKTALVGAFQQGGQIFRKGGLTVEASNSHADFFQRNLTAVRAEERVGLAVYRPGAFGLVTGL
ncbi:phage major capsid protein [Arthrobacter sp. HY1533]|uniref:phage major capsid protein n=1 Tax=Arthrobacter sp. HY1533 TaxID=2970919 RepID=UPI0022BA05FC|nr:phage major capsid protein [Arthrobacter sp. HY1533]